MDSKLLIEKINKLQDICSSFNIKNLELPQIVVIGSQSSGKTSVLENIIGKDMLPRGTGIVTRRPLIIQMINSTREYAVFSHNPNIILKYDEVKKEILNETAKIKKNDISEIPIILKLFGSEYMNLTLVDLPGLIRVTTHDQPSNLTKKIWNLVKDFASNKNAILLAVSSANTDLANSDALQLAKEIDPNFDRTVGILTKIDLMDKSENVVDILANKVVSLKRGFVPLVCRSQSQINDNLSIIDALSLEKDFFITHPSYKKNSEYCGTSYLKSKLHNLLLDHIKICLPELNTQIIKLKDESISRFKSLGYSTLGFRENCLKSIQDISNEFSRILKGDLKQTEISGGARIIYLINTVFPESLNINPVSDIKDENIRNLLYNCSSTNTVININQTFEILVKQSISELKPHCLKLVSLILMEMVKISSDSVKICPFPKLSEIILKICYEFFKELSEETMKLVTSMIEWNSKYIKLNNPDFNPQMVFNKEETKFSTRKLLSSLPNVLRMKSEITATEKTNISNVKTMISSYFEIIINIIKDQVPKCIMSEFVMKSEVEIQNYLLSKIYERRDLEEMVVESNEIKELRTSLNERIEGLKEAYDIVCTL